MQVEYSAPVNLLCAILLSAIIRVGTIQAQQVPAESSQPLSAQENVLSATLTPKTVEDWSTPSLTGSNLQPMGAVVGEVYKGDDSFTRELTRVQWRSADPIDLYILKPVGVENPAVILYLYSYPFELDRFRDDAFCRFLTKNGVAAVGFPSALTGERYHSPRPLREWFVSNLKESLSTSAHDVQMILNYLSTRGDLNMDHVGMFGDGSGAAIAILAAAVDPRIKSLDLLDPWGDWPEWIAKSTLIPEKERADFLNPEWLAEVAPLDPVKWLPELTTQKVRIRNVATVTVTPNEAKQKIEAAAPPNAEIVHFPDANAFQTAASNGIGFDWIKKQVNSERISHVGELRSHGSDDTKSGTSDNRNHQK